MLAHSLAGPGERGDTNSIHHEQDLECPAKKPTLLARTDTLFLLPENVHPFVLVALQGENSHTTKWCIREEGDARNTSQK